MDRIIFSLGNYELQLSELLGFALAAIGSYLIYYLFLKRYVPSFVKESRISLKEGKRLNKILLSILIAILIYLAITILHIDYNLLLTNGVGIISVSTLAIAFLILQLARLLDWIISNCFIHNFFARRDETTDELGQTPRDSESAAIRVVQYIVYAIALIFLLRTFNLDFDLYPRTINGEQVDFKISNIILVILTFLVARLIIWILTHIVFYRVYKNREVNVGGQYAVNQLFKYVVYMVAFVVSLQYLGINMTLILGGAAALLVGIGLGLQQTFNDFFSGLVLLFERTVEVGDVIDLAGKVGTVKQIGLRSSLIETRDNIIHIVPNSLLVSHEVTNWTHIDEKVRFDLQIGVEYGSDVEKVKEILLKIAKDNPYTIDYPGPFVRFENFGESSLDFTLYFFSRNYLVIEDIKSDMRFEINKAFKAHNISIPFPHRHVILHKGKSSNLDIQA